ncbi:hypothetical protein KC333_g5553 [Hortaea werneckii]|nr:hypothetical protein KC333_g5553 [Hortaea werneckii]KAI7308714.1 hypothetical protein KC326_g7316 [Hortaea werneckii]
MSNTQPDASSPAKSTNRFVTIHVGPEQTKFEVEKERLCRFSGYARSKIASTKSSGLRLFKPQEVCVIELEEVSPDIFSVYQEFITNDTFDLTDIATNGPLKKLVELSVLAHTLQDSVFSDKIARAVAEYVENAISPSPHPADLPHLAESFAATAVIPDTASIPASVAKVLGRLAIVEIKESTQASIVRYEGWLKERDITIEEKQEQIKILKQKNKEMQRIQAMQQEYQRRLDQELETKDDMVLKGEEHLKRAWEEAKGLSAKLRSAEMAAFDRSAFGGYQTSNTSSHTRIGISSAQTAHSRPPSIRATSTAGKRKRSPANDSHFTSNKHTPGHRQHIINQATEIDSSSSGCSPRVSRLESTATTETAPLVTPSVNRSEVKSSNSNKVHADLISDGLSDEDQQYAVL